MKSNNLKIHVTTGFLVLSIGMMFSSCENKADEQAQSGSIEAASQTAIKVETNRGRTKIGAFILNSDPLTKSFEQGAQLANNADFELKFFEASKGNSLNAESLKSLIENDKSPAVLYWSAEDVSAVAPYLSSSDAVGFVVAEVSKKVIPLGANIYGFGYSNELTFKQLAKFAGNTLKSYRFAVITANEPRYELQSEVFIEESKSLGNTIVFEEKIGADETDFSSIVARAGKENCDTIFAVLPSQALTAFIKAARANNYKGKIIVGDTLFASELAALGQDAEGIYMSQAWCDDVSLKSLYSAKYGNTPDGITLGFVALGYDVVKCLQGIAAPLDAYSIKNSLLSTPCEGLTGKTQFTGERIAQRRKKILTIKEGQFVVSE